MLSDKYQMEEIAAKIINEPLDDKNEKNEDVINEDSTDEEEYIVSTINGKRNLEEITNPSSNKKIHKSLRNDPRPILTPALRKKKEKEMDTQNVVQPAKN